MPDTYVNAERLGYFKDKVDEKIEAVVDELTGLKEDLSTLNNITNLPMPSGSIIQGSFERSGEPESPPRSDRIRIAGFVLVYKGQQLVFTPGTMITDLLIGVFDTSKSYVSNKGWYSGAKIIDIDANGYYVICFRASNSADITPLNYDAEVQIIPAWQKSSGLTDDIKTALVNCFANVMWVSSFGKNCFNALAEALDVSIGLDAIAYGNLTYRDIFVTNNFIAIGNFDNVTISDELQTLPNGDTYQINNGAPIISQDTSVTGNSCLKVVTSSMSSQVNYKSTRMPESATFLMAACVRVDGYVSGYVGMQVNVSNAGLSASMIGHTTVASTTDGFIEIVKLGSYTYDPANYPNANLNIFIGDYSQGIATGYIDACVATIVPSEMTLEDATQLYHNYIQMVRN